MSNHLCCFNISEIVCINTRLQITFSKLIMKLSLLSVLFAALALGANTLAPQKQVLITFPNDTPDSALSQAKTSIEEGVSLILVEQAQD